MALKKKRTPKLSKKAQQKIVKEYKSKPLTPEEKARAYADLQALYND
jgi:hypothetical protein